MKRMTIAALTLVTCLAVAGAMAAETDDADNDAAEEEAIQVQTTCPVMGGKINPKQFIDVEGKRIYVCCRGCTKAIKKDPGTYIKKLEDEGVTVATLQAKCPIMDGNVNRKLYADVKGKRIYVCCRGCIGAIEKDPDAIIKAFEKQNIVLDDTPKKGQNTGKHAGHNH